VKTRRPCSKQHRKGFSTARHPGICLELACLGYGGAWVTCRFRTKRLAAINGQCSAQLAIQALLTISDLFFRYVQEDRHIGKGALFEPAQDQQAVRRYCNRRRHIIRAPSAARPDWPTPQTRGPFPSGLRPSRCECHVASGTRSRASGINRINPEARSAEGGPRARTWTHRGGSVGTTSVATGSCEYTPRCGQSSPQWTYRGVPHDIQNKAPFNQGNRMQNSPEIVDAVQ
jgi:hypothetical protein